MDRRHSSLPQSDFAAPLLNRNVPDILVLPPDTRPESGHTDYSNTTELKKRISQNLAQAEAAHGLHHGGSDKWWQRLNPLSQKTWNFQILAPCLSLLSFVSLVIVLQHYNGRTLDSWPYRRLSLNGLVAFLATITRASAMVSVANCLSQGGWNWFTPRSSRTRRTLDHMEVFDEASRGAWGSLKLLWLLKARYLGSVGALLTVLFLGFDIFTQQVIGTNWRNTIHKGYTRGVSGAVARSEVYANYLPGPILGTKQAELPMQAAIYNGVMNGNTAPMGTICSTGNCTWPIVPSLAVCGECTDRSDALNLTIVRVTHPSGKELNTTYKYTLPGGNTLVASTGATADYLQPVFMAASSNDMSVYNTTRMFGAGSKEIGRPYLFSFDAIGTAWNTTYTSPATVEDAVGAATCALWFCVKPYNVFTRFGSHSEVSLEVWEKAQYREDSIGWEFIDVPEFFNVEPGRSFQLDSRAQQALNFALDGVLGGNVSMGESTFEQYHSSSGIQGLWEGLTNLTANASESQFIRKLALDMTNAVRLSAPANSTARYDGVAYTTDAYVDVRWPWLTFPAAMVMGSILFLLASVWQTRRSGIPAWKSSPLELLFFRLSEDLQARSTMENMTRPGTLVRSVGGVRAVLDQQDGSWMFRAEEEKA